VLDELGAEHLGQLSRGVAAESIHLPETVLSGDEPLCEGQVVEVSGTDVRDTAVIALNRNTVVQAREGEGPLDLRQSTPHCVVDPEVAA